MLAKNQFLLILLMLELASVKALSINDSTKVNELNKKVMETVYNNTTKAKAYGFEALNLARQIGFRKGEGIALIRIGIAYDVESNFDSAITYYNQSIPILKAINYKKGQGGALCNLGLAYLNKNDYPSALKHLQAAIKPLTEIREHASLGSCYNNIALIFLEMDNYSKALNYLRLAENEYNISGNSYQMAKIYGNYAMIMSENLKYDSAILLEQIAIKYFEKDSDYFHLAKSYNNIGIDYIMLKDYKQAEKAYLKSIEYSIACNGKTGLADTYFNLATVYSIIEDYKASEYYAQLAMNMLPVIKSRKIKSDLFYLYARIKMRQGDYKEACKLFNSAKWQKDSFFKIESAELISKAETRFGLELKENENRQLLQKNKIQELELRNSNTEVAYRKKVNILIATLAVIIIGLTLLYLRRRLILQKLIAENRLKSEQQSQRVHISHELHDNVGAQLSYIVSNLDVLRNAHPEDKRLQSVTDMSKQAIVTLRETVWALNNESISVTDFADKFKQYTSKILDFNPDVQCKFKEQIESENILQPIQALNFFRICQEAFSNAIHHSKAKNIHIEFSNTDKILFHVVIEDDGIGFDHEEAALKGHYGLITMRTRAEELGATFNIYSKKGSGTRVEFDLSHVSK